MHRGATRIQQRMIRSVQLVSQKMQQHNWKFRCDHQKTTILINSKKRLKLTRSCSGESLWHKSLNFRKFCIFSGGHWLKGRNSAISLPRKHFSLHGQNESHKRAVMKKGLRTAQIHEINISILQPHRSIQSDPVPWPKVIILEALQWPHKWFFFWNKGY